MARAAVAAVRALALVRVPVRVAAEQDAARRRGDINCRETIHRVMIAHSGKIWSYDWLRQAISDCVTFFVGLGDHVGQ